MIRYPLDPFPPWNTHCAKYQFSVFKFTLPLFFIFGVQKFWQFHHFAIRINSCNFWHFFVIFLSFCYPCHFCRFCHFMSFLSFFCHFCHLKLAVSTEIHFQSCLFEFWTKITLLTHCASKKVTIERERNFHSSSNTARKVPSPYCIH